MIDPMLSLAMSMHANPGVYALLLGSGVSRSAEIPTGWEVVLDLIRKLAALEDEDCEPSPEVWYNNKYDVEPTYSGLLNAVAKSPADRSQLLRGYFEPSEDDDEGSKVPTAAHHAIAQLVKSGHVRVILTTNFDRLMEQALEAIGVNPTVISSPDAVEGAMPITHSKCTIVKLHGDYLDIRSKNTPDELQEYDEKIDGLLDRVLDEFGLVVCGWSAEWDAALRGAIERCKGRRFTTYWATRGEPSDAAKKVIQLRSAETISIDGADEFFPQLAEKVDALASFDRPHPMSAKIAVAQTKKYLVDPKYKIQLHDLLMGEVEKIMEETSADKYPVTGSFNEQDIAGRFKAFGGISDVALHIMIAGCFWGEEAHQPFWIKAIDRLANPPRPQQWNERMYGLRSYPAVLLHYAGGIASLAADNYALLLALLTRPKVREGNDAEMVSMGLFDRPKQDAFKVLPGLERRKLARSAHLLAKLRDSLRHVVPDDRDYQRFFDRFEVIQSFVVADKIGWAMPGDYMLRHRLERNQSALSELTAEAEAAGEEWPLFKLGLAQATTGRWEEIKTQVTDMIQNVVYR